MKRSHYTLPFLALLAACTPPGETKLPPQAVDAQVIQTAETLRQSGDVAGAVRVLRQAQMTQPNNPLVISQLGYALIAANQPQEAITTFDQLMTLQPNNISAYNGKAVALDRTGNHQAAQELYHQALKFSPSSFSIQNNLAMSMILGDQFEPAIALLEDLNKQSPNNMTVRQNLALAYGIKGNTDKARALNMQDLSQAEAEENMRFYQQYASEHKKSVPLPVAAVTPATPAPAPLAIATPAPTSTQVTNVPPQSPIPAKGLPTIAPAALPDLAPAAGSPAVPAPPMPLPTPASNNDLPSFGDLFSNIKLPFDLPPADADTTYPSQH